MHQARIRLGREYGHPITRVECDFPGCLMPPALHCRYCCAHKKQRDRGQPLRPYAPRTDVEERWEAWAQARVKIAKRNVPRFVHEGCGGVLRVYNTHANGIPGLRYALCNDCRRPVAIEPDGSQRITARYRNRCRECGARGRKRLCDKCAAPIIARGG